MTLHRVFAVLVLIFVADVCAADESVEKWDRDAGKPAPNLVAASWLGTPVSLDAVKGNTVVLVFWNLDVPWC